MSGVDAAARKRSAGAWFVDFLDNSASASLPLLPDGLAERLGGGKLSS